MTYYTRSYDPQPTTRIASTDLKNEFQSVKLGFDAVEEDVEKGVRAPEAMTALPNALSRALKVMSFDASGNPRATIAEADLAAAVTAASNAASSASSASSSATAAAGSATIASTQATNAGNSATAAATSASQASTSAINAAGSAATATTQATNAATSATNAATSASAAAGSASAAATSATSASTSAGDASTSASAAATSASNAATSESNAATSAGTATTQAGIAITKAAEAAASAASIAGGPVTSVNGQTGVVTLTAADVGAVTPDGTQTLTNKTLTDPAFTGAIYDNGSSRSNVVAVAALAIDCSLGNYFTKTISANSTFTFTNVPASVAYAFTLELTHTSGTVTWPAAVQWPNATAPTLTTGRTHVFVFLTDDGGTRWRGVANTNYTT